MKSKDVLRLLRVSRQSLNKYVKQGIIRTITLPNGWYDYNEEDVYKFFNKGVERKTYLYARVSTHNQKNDLDNQIESLKQYCYSNGYKIHDIFSDIASGIDFDKRKDFFVMLDDIIAGRVEKVIITYKDRLSRVGFSLFTKLFEQFNCKIIVISEVGNSKLDSQEIFEEIVSLLHCYSMKLYSKRRIKKLREVIIDKSDKLD